MIIKGRLHETQLLCRFCSFWFRLSKLITVQRQLFVLSHLYALPESVFGAYITTSLQLRSVKGVGLYIIFEKCDMFNNMKFYLHICNKAFKWGVSIIDEINITHLVCWIFAMDCAISYSSCIYSSRILYFMSCSWTFHSYDSFPDSAAENQRLSNCNVTRTFECSVNSPALLPLRHDNK